MWDAKAREVRLLSERSQGRRLRFPDEFAAAIDEDPSLAAVVAGQRDIFDARRQVLHSQARVVGEKILQVEEIAGLGAQELAASKRAEIARQEIGAVQTLVDKGLERRPRLLALEREAAEIHGRRGELTAQISRRIRSSARSVRCS